MKPTLPQGTRDFSADVVRKRNYIFDTIREVFELYGFQPLETPAMENIETLMGKYGEEGDKLIFRILESGNPFSVNFFKEFNEYFFKELSEYLKAKYEDTENAKEQFPNLVNPFGNPLWNLDPGFLTQISKDLLQSPALTKLKSNVSEKALRYDLTIPFARYVAMNHGKLSFPFKRYQIQPVWRADRPQKGRYREFYQCDADIVGNYSLLNEVELTNIYAEVFKRLKIDVEIRINNRKILTALAEICGGVDKMLDITIAIDKLDKIGINGVKKELEQRKLNDEQINIIEKYLQIAKFPAEDFLNDIMLEQLKLFFANSELGRQGIREMEFVLDYGTSEWPNNIVTDVTLARGLNYYTGIIYEIKAKAVQIGSIGGGGRYDDLTGLFGVPNLPGVGISFGVDRIYDVMEELKLFPENVYTGTQVLFFNLGEKEGKAAYGLMQQLRATSRKCEIYHEQAKFDKQFKYAEKKNIPFAVIIGTKELEQGSCMYKNLKTGEQKSIKQADLLTFSFE